MAETIISLRPIHAFHSISPPLMHPASRRWSSTSRVHWTLSPPRHNSSFPMVNADAQPDGTDGGDILSGVVQRNLADGMLTPQAATPSQLTSLVEPLLNLLNQSSRQLAPLLEQGGAQVDQVVAPVSAKLQEWSLTLQPLVERGGDEVSKALAPVHEALVQLLARLEPYTTPAIDAARGAVTSVVDVIKGLLHQLAPLWQEACRGTMEWHATRLQPFLATTGDQIKATSVAALEDVKLRGVAVAQAHYHTHHTHHTCHTCHTDDLSTPSILTRLHRAHRTSPGHAAMERDRAAAVGGADGPDDPGADVRRRWPRAGVERKPVAALVGRDQRGPVCRGDRVVGRGAALLLPAHRERRGHGGAQGARGQVARPRATREGTPGLGRLSGRGRADRRRLEGTAQAPTCCHIVHGHYGVHARGRRGTVGPASLPV
jgi:hypothetical protein